MTGSLAPPLPVLRKLFAGFLAAATACGCVADENGLSKTKRAESPPSREVAFREVAREVGLDFQHFTGATGEFLFHENMGSGVALLDYDGDGDLDVYFLQGALVDPSKSLKDCLFPPPAGSLPQSGGPQNRLFRNELVEEGKLRFVDVTRQAGVGDQGFGMGAAVGDYDNDGDWDLYVTNFGANVLYRNNGDGTFTDVTSQAGVDDVRWSVSAAFLDYDQDRDLDLFLTNYVDFTVLGNRACLNSLGERDYCSPEVYQPVPDRLFRNEGNGKFTNVTESAGIVTAFGKGLGVVCADFDGDAWIDIYVANDQTPNQLWIHQSDGTFEDMGLMSGTAYNADGLAEAGMGVGAGDFDNDGDEDLFMTHLVKETNTLYVNDGKAKFSDKTRQFSLASPSFAYTGFGTEWFDCDNDGDLDLFAANGAVYIVESLRGEPYPYHQKNQLFRNEGGSRFRDVTGEAGPALDLSEVSRGAAFGDIDNDGDIDIVVANSNGPGRLLLNEAASGHHWLEVRLEGVGSNRHGIGARVGVLRTGQSTLWRRAHTDGSYASASDYRVHFGLGRVSDLVAVVVEWPGGKKETWEQVQADRAITLREGSGKPHGGTPR